MRHTKAIVHVHRGGGALEDTQSLDNWRGHAILRLVDVEVAERALCLGAPVLVGRHLNLAKGIGLSPSVRGHGNWCGVEQPGAAGDMRLSVEER